MNKYIIFLVLAFSLNIPAQSQDSSEETAVKAVIQKMFDAMRAGDSSALLTVFHKDVVMLTTYFDKEGKSKMHQGELQKFADAVGTPHEEIWDEKIWSYEIKIDANMATAWTEYTFYLGEKLSHCGVNAFTLFNSEVGWKIIHLIDTRRRTECQE